LRRLLREPLLHFLVAGAVLFAVHRLLHPPADGPAASHRIEVTEDDLRQLSLAWVAQGRPRPTPEQMRSLVESRIREEILYREALALGLDRGDTIVKRRMAQKMEFLAEDLSALHEPPTGELRAWFEGNAERFALPPRATFRHLYFSPDRRGTRARDDAARALEQLAGKPAERPGRVALADPFMFQDYYGDRAFDELAAAFGRPFAEALFELPPGSWRGPIESGYGWHLVFLDSLTPSRLPAFEEVESDVRSAWVAAQREAFKRRAYEEMRTRYEVVLPAGLAAGVSASSEMARAQVDP
jgi:hypothetical protein